MTRAATVLGSAHRRAIGRQIAGRVTEALIRTQIDFALISRIRGVRYQKTQTLEVSGDNSFGEYMFETSVQNNCNLIG